MTGSRLVVLKLGGELLEEPAALSAIGAAIAGAGRDVPLVVVHGGGREIDRALASAGIEKRQVDGIRVTNPETLDVVVATLAGLVNTRLVAAVVSAGGRAVGLTGADAAIGRASLAAPLQARDGRLVPLGLVGVPEEGGRAPQLLVDLVAARYIPIVASIGLSPDGRLLNVNADVMAAGIATRLSADALVVAGTTAGVLDAHGATIDALDPAALSRITTNGTATAGMIAKLDACRTAVVGGVRRVTIVDGRHDATLAAELKAQPPDWPVRGTRIVSSAPVPWKQAAVSHQRPAARLKAEG